MSTLAARPPRFRPPEQRQWTEARIVAALRALAAKGVSIDLRGLAAVGEHRLAHAVNHFGGFRRLRGLAGLARPRRRRHGPELEADGLLAELRRRADVDEPLACARVPAELQSLARRHFGSWRAAIAAAGLDYGRIRLTRRYSDDELLDRLRELARAQPQMTMRELRRDSVASTWRARFGSLDGAVRAAGLTDWPLVPVAGADASGAARGAPQARRHAAFGLAKRISFNSDLSCRK